VIGTERVATKPVAPTRQRAERLDRLAREWLVISILAVVALLWLVPFAWMLSISFSAKANAAISNPPEWIPSDFGFVNYANVFVRAPMPRYFLNSVIVGGSVAILEVLLCSFAAYAFAKGRFPGRSALFVVALSTMMVPHEMTLIPMFLLMNQYGLLNTYWALILPAIASGFGVFLITQFMRGIPDELLDAARIDGAGEHRIWAQIVMPLVQPALATLAVLAFLGQWNSFLYPLVMLSDSDKYTVTIGLMSFVQDEGQVWWGNVMAAASMAIVPVLLLFVALQRYVIQGIALTGLKG
jgi:multiple sugar transport system permease protein